MNDWIAGLDRSIGPTCLVTGGSGYLGRYLTRALLQLGCTVRVLDVAPYVGEGVQMFQGDVRDPSLVRAAVDGVDTVFHAAAVISLLGIARRPVHDRVFGINLQGTRVVLEAARAAGVGRFVYTSSANVVIDRELVEADESVGYASTWVDLYGESKAAAELEVLSADDPAGMRTIALRPGGIWGPGDAGFMIRAFLQQLASGSFVATIGDGSAVVDNTYVGSLVRAELLAAGALASKAEVVGGHPYFITDNERLNGITWFKPIVHGLGVPWPTRRLPGQLMYGLAWSMEMAHWMGLSAEPPLTRIGILKLIRSSAFSIERARRDLAYEPLLRSRDGLETHLDDYRVLYESYLSSSRR